MPHPPSKQDRTVGAVFIKGFASSPTDTTREQLSFHARHIHRPNKIVRLDPFSSRDLLLFRRDSAGAALLSRASFCPVLCQQRRSQRIQIYGRVLHGAMWPNRAFFSPTTRSAPAYTSNQTLSQIFLHPLIQTLQTPFFFSKIQFHSTCIPSTWMCDALDDLWWILLNRKAWYGAPG